MAEQVTVLVERCTMQIYLEPFFDTSTLVNIRKLFRYVFQEPWRNTETIKVLGSYLAEKVAGAKDNICCAENGYKTAISALMEIRSQVGLFASCATKELKNEHHVRSIQYMKCQKAIGIAKTKYERWLKISALYKDFKQKA